jgi:hypothetical protein
VWLLKPSKKHGYTSVSDITSLLSLHPSPLVIRFISMLYAISGLPRCRHNFEPPRL